jgi:hypothetical protein
MQMLKLSPDNHLTLTDTLYTALNNVRDYLFHFTANTKNVIQYSCAVTFQVFGLFCGTRLTPCASNFGLIPEK